MKSKVKNQVKILPSYRRLVYDGNAFQRCGSFGSNVRAFFRWIGGSRWILDFVFDVISSLGVKLYGVALRIFTRGLTGAQWVVLSGSLSSSTVWFGLIDWSPIHYLFRTFELFQCAFFWRWGSLYFALTVISIHEPLNEQNTLKWQL